MQERTEVIFFSGSWSDKLRSGAVFRNGMADPLVEGIDWLELYAILGF